MRNVISGSGSEDIGANIAAEARNRAAEDAARQRRINKDKVVFAALDALETAASTYHFPEYYILGATDIRDLSDDTSVSPDGNQVYVYIRELLAEIRASLSPLAR